MVFSCSLFPIPCSLFPLPYSRFPIPDSLLLRHSLRNKTSPI
ncbi:hypothetical protein [Moorena sp. SIO3I6]|nr:hypothetical protein [Moorena sp. SIO3I6]